MTETDPNVLSAQDCLVALMIAVSASDEDIRTAELVKIQSSVNMLPVFAEYDIDRMNRSARKNLGVVLVVVNLGKEIPSSIARIRNAAGPWLIVIDNYGNR